MNDECEIHYVNLSSVTCLLSVQTLSGMSRVTEPTA